MDSSDSAVTARAVHERQHGARLAAADTDRVWGWGTPAGRRRAARRGRMIAEAAALGPGRRALEVGCGTGVFTEIFAATGADVVALDLSPDLVRIATGRLGQHPRVELRVQALDECHDGPFDAVVGSSVLHHLELAPALRRMFELLARGGILSFAEPNMLNPPDLRRTELPAVLPVSVAGRDGVRPFAARGGAARDGLRGRTHRPLRLAPPGRAGPADRRGVRARARVGTTPAGARVCRLACHPRRASRPRVSVE